MKSAIIKQSLRNSSFLEYHLLFKVKHFDSSTHDFIDFSLKGKTKGIVKVSMKSCNRVNLGGFWSWKHKTLLYIPICKLNHGSPSTENLKRIRRTYWDQQGLFINKYIVLLFCAGEIWMVPLNPLDFRNF